MITEISGVPTKLMDAADFEGQQRRRSDEYVDNGLTHEDKQKEFRERMEFYSQKELREKMMIQTQ